MSSQGLVVHKVGFAAGGKWPIWGVISTRLPGPLGKVGEPADDRLRER